MLFILKVNKFPIIEPVIKLVPTIKPIGNCTVSSTKKLTLLLFELFCKPITNNVNKQELIIGLQNNSNKSKVDFLVEETVKLPIGFIVGTSFITGSIIGNFFTLSLTNKE